jgi:hypothetical protein
VTQTDTLRAFDAIIVDGMKTLGIADAATYTPPGGGAGIPCNVLIDRAAQFYDDIRGVAGTRIQVMIFRNEVPAPARLGTLAIAGETFKLDQLDSRDESMTRWVVVV